MASVLSFQFENYNDTKFVLRAIWKGSELACCKLTVFALQKTVHVWLAIPLFYDKHGVTSFQKFDGTIPEIAEVYSSLFRELVWLLVPVCQKKTSLEMAAQKCVRVHPVVATLVRALIVAKKNVTNNKNHAKGNAQENTDGSGSHSDSSSCGVTSNIISHSSHSSSCGVTSSSNSSHSSSRRSPCRHVYKKRAYARYRVDDRSAN